MTINPHSHQQTAVNYRLGQSQLCLSALGLGTWQFSSGQGTLGGHWNPLTQSSMQAIVAAALKAGINWFDTAEAYGDGASEKNLSSALNTLQIEHGAAYIADKWWPKQRSASSLLETIEQRKACLQGRPIDLYQIHWPESKSWLRTEMKALAKLVHEGHVGAVGLCNYSSKLLRKAHKYLKREGVELASVQLHYNLLQRSIEHNDQLAQARDLGVSVIAWSPLEQGLLTGRFHRDPALLQCLKPSRQQMFDLTPARLQQTQPMMDTLQTLADRYHASTGQIALAWLTQYHDDQVFAIPGASNVEQVLDNAAALQLQLSASELAALSELSNHCLRESQ